MKGHPLNKIHPESDSLRFLFPKFSTLSKKTDYPLSITFIFDECRHSCVTVAPVKYKSDSNNLTAIFGSLNISLTEK